MKAFTTLVALAGTIGAGYLVYKKINEQMQAEQYLEEYENSQNENRKKGKVRRASMYAVGAIKTTADKISEGIKQVKAEDMVKKGEETVDRMKNAADELKEQLKETAGNIKNSVKGTTGNIKEELKDTTKNIKGELKEIKNLVTSINSSPDSSEESETFINKNSRFISEGIPEAEEMNDIDSSLFEETEIIDRL